MRAGFLGSSHRAGVKLVRPVLDTADTTPGEKNMSLSEFDQIQAALNNRRRYAQTQYETEMKAIDDAAADAGRAYQASLSDPPRP
jgi:hypothetical protein